MMFQDSDFYSVRILKICVLTILNLTYKNAQKLFCYQAKNMSTKFHSIILHICIKEEICDISNLRKDLVWLMASNVICSPMTWGTWQRIVFHNMVTI